MMRWLTRYRKRRLLGVLVLMGLVIGAVCLNPASYEAVWDWAGAGEENTGVGVAGVTDGGAGMTDGGAGEMGGVEASTDGAEGPLATEILEQLEVKGRAPKTGYDREEFYSDWPMIEGCSLRQRIIKREFGETAVLDSENRCTVVAGEYDEPYTGEHKVFRAREEISDGVQIDHIVALSDAWQKGAQYLDVETRRAIATDPLNLIAADAAANQQKSDGDAATWLPPNKGFRCQYVARQIAVKYKYGLWVTEAEKAAMLRVLEVCPGQTVVGVEDG